MGTNDNLSVNYLKKTQQERRAELQKQAGITPTVTLSFIPQPIEEDIPPIPLPEEVTPNEDEGGFLSSVGEFVKEAIPQTISGVGDALNNALETGKDLGEMFGIPDVGIQIYNEEGDFDLGFYGPKEAKEKGRSAKIIPIAEEAKTPVGGMARSLSEFVTGFIPATKAVGAAGVAVGAARTITASALAQAVVADPHQARLATVLNEIPILQKIVPDYLADNNPENENEWEGRLKNAIDMAGVAGAGEGVALGARKLFKMYKAGQVAKTAQKGKAVTPEVAIAEAEAAIATKTEAAKIISPIESPITPKELLVKEPSGKVYLNTERINTTEDIHKVLKNAAEAIIDPKAGTKTIKGIKKASTKELKDLDTLLSRRIERPFTAEEAVASREVLNASAESLSELAKGAMGPTASPEGMYTFRKALAAHNDIQEVVLAGRKATAQSLMSWKIPAGSPEARGKQIAAILEGKQGTIDQMAKAIHDVSTHNPTGLSKMAAQITDPTWEEALYQVWVNGLLSGPATHAVNALSNAGTTMMGLTEKYISVGFDAARGGGKAGLMEANAKTMGFFSGLKDTWKLLRGTDPILQAGSKLEYVGRESAISAKLIGQSPDSLIGKGMDWISEAVDLPGKALLVGDNFFKGINYRMQLHEMSVRTAMSEGLTGRALSKRAADLIANPTEAIQDIAVDFARYQTFTNETGAFVKAAQKAINESPYGAGKYIMPFVRTPANIFKYSLERTPLAPLMSEVRAEIAKGGTNATMALAKITGGTMLMAGAAGLTLEGKISGSGPLNPQESATLRATGWQPYSVKMGDTWFGFSRLEPVGSLIAYAADMASMASELSDDDNDNLVAMGIAAFSQQMASKTFVSGAVSAMEALASGDPYALDRWSKQFAASFVPFSAAGKTINKYTDPVKRDYRNDDHMGFLRSTVEKMKENTGFLSTDAAPLRDVWGKELRWDDGVIPFLENLSPVEIRQNETDPVNRLVAEKRLVLSRPARRIKGVKLTNKEYSEYSKIAGETLKKQLDKLVGKKKARIDKLTQEQLQLIFSNVASKSKEYARGQMLKNSLGLKERIIDNMREEQAQRGGK